MPLSKQSLRKQIKEIEFDPRSLPYNLIFQGMSSSDCTKMAMMQLKTALLQPMGSRQNVIEAVRLLIVGLELHAGESTGAAGQA